jgi:hypothetical protein
MLGRFLSVDPLIGDAGDTQALNPYVYVGNRPLAATDPSGLDAIIVPGGPCGGVCESAIASAIITLASLLGGHAQPPPPATALPGRSAQSGVGICGAGTFSPTCNGMILYAGVPSMGSGGPGTSSWGISDEENYELENLEQFFVDLGINSIDVLILGTYYDGWAAVHAAQEGDFLRAMVYTGFTVCDLATSCGSAFKPLRRLKSASKAFRGISSEEVELVQRAMSKSELEATLQTGKMRGGRAGTHYVSDSVNSTANRARQRLALPVNPQVRVTLAVPAGTFSKPSRVRSMTLPDGTVLQGGGMERSAVGDIPVSVIKVDDL